MPGGCRRARQTRCDDGREPSSALASPGQPTQSSRSRGNGTTAGLGRRRRCVNRQRRDQYHCRTHQSHASRSPNDRPEENREHADARTTPQDRRDLRCGDVPRLSEELVWRCDELLKEGPVRRNEGRRLDRRDLHSCQQGCSGGDAERRICRREQSTALCSEQHPICRWQQEERRNSGLLGQQRAREQKNRRRQPPCRQPLTPGVDGQGSEREHGPQQFLQPRCPQNGLELQRIQQEHREARHCGIDSSEQPTGQHLHEPRRAGVNEQERTWNGTGEPSPILASRRNTTAKTGRKKYPCAQHV